MSKSESSKNTPVNERVKAFTSLVALKLFQLPIFWSDAKTLVLHWSRQLGKSYVLGAWAVYRIVTKLVAGQDWAVFVLSNSKRNGSEFMQKVAIICRLFGVAMQQEDLSADDTYEAMQFVCRFSLLGRTGRIEVLAADPRTARGFSGDLILDEFAFHLNSAAIWEAAEPILSANPDFECRIASTGNGTSNKFYEMVRGAMVIATGDNPAGLSVSEAGFIVSRVPRSAAYLLGQKIYDLKSGRPITPAAAREAALDKSAYDVNYELALSDAGSQLLNDDDINGCEYQGAGQHCVLCEQEWSAEALEFLAAQPGPLGFGMDVGRTRNLSTIAVGPKVGAIIYVRAILRMRDMRLPAQKDQLARLFELSNIGAGEVDMTGLGLGFVEFAQDELGAYRVAGVNFSSSEQRDERQALIAAQMGLPKESANVKELMGLAERVLAQRGRTLDGAGPAPAQAYVFCTALAAKMRGTCATTVERLTFITPFFRALAAGDNAFTAARVRLIYAQQCSYRAGELLNGGDLAGAVAIATAPDVLLNPATCYAAVTTTAQAKARMRAPDALSWAKLGYVMAPTAATPAAVNLVSAALRAADLNLGRANAWIAAQNDAAAPNVLAAVPYPEAVQAGNLPEPAYATVNLLIRGQGAEALRLRPEVVNQSGTLISRRLVYHPHISDANVDVFTASAGNVQAAATTAATARDAAKAALDAAQADEQEARDALDEATDTHDAARLATWRARINLATATRRGDPAAITAAQARLNGARSDETDAADDQRDASADLSDAETLTATRRREWVTAFTEAQRVQENATFTALALEALLLSKAN